MAAFQAVKAAMSMPMTGRAAAMPANLLAICWAIAPMPSMLPVRTEALRAARVNSSVETRVALEALVLAAAVRSRAGAARREDWSRVSRDLEASVEPLPSNIVRMRMRMSSRAMAISPGRA